MIKRCAIYIRVSTAEQALEGWSLDAQKAALTGEAHRRGFLIAGYYVDEGKSARKSLRKRQAIRHLLDDVRAGLIDVIMFKDITRWFRSVSDFYTVQKVLDEAGVAWIAAEQPQLNMETPDGRLQVNVLLSVGQNEADQTSERIKYVNTYLRSVRRWTSGVGSLPRGFGVSEDHHIVMDPATAPIVRMLLSEFGRTGSVNASVASVNAAYPDLGMSYGSGMLCLRSPLLCGEYRGDPDFVEGPTYLTRDEYDDLQRRLGHNCKVANHRTFVFSGLLFCSDCGRRLSGGTGGSNNCKIYRCNGYRMGKRCGNSHTISEHRLEVMLFGYVKKALEDRIVEIRSVREARVSGPRPVDNSARIDAALNRLRDLYLNPVGVPMTRAEYQARYDAIEAKRVVPDAPAEDLPDPDHLEKIKTLLESGVGEVYDSMSELERREFWRGILDHVDLRGSQITGIKFV